jgi:aspartate 1-decarboxylase
VYRKLLQGKIHAATVTGADLEYEGSIAVDIKLLRAAGILESESVHVWNLTNGERFETYTIASPAGSGEVIVNGAAARSVQKGDRVIIAAFTWLTVDEIAKHKPSIALLDGANRLKTKKKKK